MLQTRSASPDATAGPVSLNRKPAGGGSYTPGRRRAERRVGATAVFRAFTVLPRLGSAAPVPSSLSRKSRMNLRNCLTARLTCTIPTGITQESGGTIGMSLRSRTATSRTHHRRCYAGARLEGVAVFSILLMAVSAGAQDLPSVLSMFPGQLPKPGPTSAGQTSDARLIAPAVTLPNSDHNLRCSVNLSGYALAGC